MSTVSFPTLLRSPAPGCDRLTFCLGITVADGLIGMADTRITQGSQVITARKITVHDDSRHRMFIMTSGLRSVRDKVLTYFNETLEDGTVTFDKLYQAANAFSEQLRRVAAEDRESLGAGNLDFNLTCLIGGQLKHDKEPKLYMVYPEANWVEVPRGTPYAILGESGYGKPLLDRVLSYGSSVEVAIKAGFLAFDATVTSTASVSYPMDVVLCLPRRSKILTHRYLRADLEEPATHWNWKLRNLVESLPSDWLDPLLDEKSGDNVTALSMPPFDR